uniref:Phorbol-ester/DAG-type domain-containing protein n=1 Tax=Panagrolaimus sp. PS1159 TaxID=55785 RepID=A0AC35ERZ8_9BILA
MPKEIVVNFKGKDFVIIQNSDDLPIDDSLEQLTMFDRISALQSYKYLSPLMTLKSAEQKISILKECEFLAYKNRRTNDEYLFILHNFFSKIFPEINIQINDDGQKYVSELSESQVYAIIGNIINFLEKLNGFDTIHADSEYKNIIIKTKNMKYANIQEFTNDVQKIFFRLKKSKILAKVINDMSEKYANYFDLIFQHCGYCCSEKIEKGVHSCMICKRIFHDLCENYFQSVDGNDFVCSLYR